MPSDQEICQKLLNWATQESGSQNHCPLSHQNSELAILLKNNALTTCPACAFAIRHKALNAQDMKPEEKGRWQNLWLRHCLSNEGSVNYLFACLSRLQGDNCEIRVDREEDVEMIITEGLAHDQAPLAKVVLTTAARNYYRQICEEWFLKRYAFAKAWRCFKQRGGLSLLGIVEWSRFIFPRLWGGIIIGYLPLLLQGDCWKLAVGHSWYVIIFLALFALGLCAFYFLNEVKTNVKPTPDCYWLRAWKIFGLGWGISLITGLFFIILLGGQCLKDTGFFQTRQSITWFWSSWEIFLPLWFFYASWALLIGIFVQILWEEKPVTEPI